MKRNRSIPPSQVIPVLTYPDVRAAVDWLCAAFGVTEHVWIGPNHRAQLMFGTGGIIAADATRDRAAPTAGTGETHSVMVRVEDAHAHCAHARAHGAEILEEPHDWEYGERQYAARDLAGHRWTFSQTLDDIEPESFGCKTVAPYPS
ncbi:MAG: VOC family protein [Kofleriaceae bacterium]